MTDLDAFVRDAQQVRESIDLLKALVGGGPLVCLRTVSIGDLQKWLALLADREATLTAHEQGHTILVQRVEAAEATLTAVTRQQRKGPGRERPYR